MDKLKQLEIKKLFKELEWVESDCEYKNQIVSEIDSVFINTVNEVLNEFPELKEKFDEKINKKMDEFLKKKSEEVDDDELPEEDEKPNDPKSKKSKKVYREIVKLTHPDKVSDEELNNLYLEATKYYELDDVIALYSVCSKLNIPYELDDIDISLIKEKIKNLKSRIFFVESTYTWKWYESQTDEEKKNIILNYVNNQIK